MNEQIKKLMLKAEYASPELATRAQTLALLLIEECAKICSELKFTTEGPGEQAAYQRTLCEMAIKENFGLVSKGPITAKNVK
jgi:hypothetical protein